MARLAVVGLGIMGGGVAANLVKAGHSVRVYNRTASKAGPLLQAGAEWGETPRQAAAGAEMVFSIVADDEASRAMWTGPAGALAGMARGSLAVECSTLSLPWVKELRGLAAAAGVELVDAPLAGSKNAAQAGALTMFIGALPETLLRVSPIIAAFASGVVHMGGPGAGAATKLVNNMLSGAQVAAAGEAMALAEALGLNLELVGQVLMTGAPSSPVVKMKIPAMLAHEYQDTHFALRWMAKDMRYALLAAEAARVTLPIGQMTGTVYADALAAGRGELDFAAVAEGPRPGG